MPLFRANERNTVESIARLTYCNPFDAEFIERERSILGSDYVPHGAVWSLARKLTRRIRPSRSWPSSRSG